MTNKNDLCREFGVNISTVNAWLVKGLPYITKGSKQHAYEFDLEAVRRWLDEREKQARPQTTGNTSEIAAQRARLMRHKANLAAMQEAELAGKLVRAETVMDEAYSAAQTARIALTQMADTLAAELATLTDENEIRKLISKEVNNALSELVRLNEDAIQAGEAQHDQLVKEHGPEKAQLIRLGIDAGQEPQA